jgi:hypothetical protein
MGEKTLSATPVFVIGDFVRVKEGTHQEDMPASRMGHIQSYANGTRLYNNQGVTVSHRDQYYVYMTNGTTLKFHEMFLELVDDKEKSNG